MLTKVAENALSYFERISKTRDMKNSWYAKKFLACFVLLQPIKWNAKKSCMLTLLSQIMPLEKLAAVKLGDFGGHKADLFQPVHWAG